MYFGVATASMRKIQIFGTFLLAISTVLLSVVVQIINYQKATIDRIAPSTEELKQKAEKMGSLRLTENEVQDICTQLNQELLHLANLKWAIGAAIFLLLTFIVWSFSKFNLKRSRFDGLSLIIVILLLYGFDPLVYEFSGSFYAGHNAAMNISIAILIGTIIIAPLLFYAAYRMNKIEYILNLHKQKWVSYIAIALTVLSLQLALIAGIGVLITPDLSGNIT